LANNKAPLRKKARKTFLTVLYLLIPVVVILAGTEFALFSYVSRLIRVPKKTETVDPKDLLIPANDILFRTEDGVDLHGWLIQGKPGFPVLIVAHDYGSNRSDTLSNLEGLITKLNKLGYWVFLFDFRGHGESSSSSSLGLREDKDMQAALQTVLKYKQIGRRVGVLGIGMGAYVASDTLKTVDEVKVVVLDSICSDLQEKYGDRLIADWPFVERAKPILFRAVGYNMRFILEVPETDAHLIDKMPSLYPKAVVFVEKKPLQNSVKQLYEAAKEPKELLLLDETAEGELMGDLRQAYNDQVGDKIIKYLPSVTHEKTIDLTKE